MAGCQLFPAAGHVQRRNPQFPVADHAADSQLILVAGSEKPVPRPDACSRGRFAAGYSLITISKSRYCRYRTKLFFTKMWQIQNRIPHFVLIRRNRAGYNFDWTDSNLYSYFSNCQIFLFCQHILTFGRDLFLYVKQTNQDSEQEFGSISAKLFFNGGVTIYIYIYI